MSDPWRPAPGDRALDDPAAWPWLRTLGPRVVDLALVAGVAVVVLASLLMTGQATTRTRLAPFAVLAGLVSVAAVVVRRRLPRLAVVALTGLLVGMSVVRQQVDAEYSYELIPVVLAPVAALSGVVPTVVRRQPADVAAVLAIAGALAIGSILAWPMTSEERLVFSILLGGSYAIGVGTGTYLRDLDRQRHQAARSARLDERLDLARELHDLVAHHVTAMVVQAQAARVVADRSPEAAGAALDRIEGAGKDALVAMRSLVGSLRQGDGSPAAPVAPPVGLAGLDDLVGSDVAHGLDVTLDVDDEARRRTPGAVAASVHRIVLESLTNVRRHAIGATRAEVTVRLEGPVLVVTVADDGRLPVGGARPDPHGYGLVGMHERAHALGGTLTAGPLDPPVHGWRVEARLPLDGPETRR